MLDGGKEDVEAEHDHYYQDHAGGGPGAGGLAVGAVAGGYVVD